MTAPVLCIPPRQLVRAEPAGDAVHPRALDGRAAVLGVRP
jgi:hypothetical protein